MDRQYDPTQARRISRLARCVERLPQFLGEAE
jgi:hypothetical protein